MEEEEDRKRMRMEEEDEGRIAGRGGLEEDEG